MQQNKTTRAIFQLHFKHTTCDCFRKQSDMNVADTYELNLSSLQLDYNKKHKNDYISRNLNPIMDSHENNTRHGANLQIIGFNRTQSQKSFVHQSVKV